MALKKIKLKSIMSVISFICLFNMGLITLLLNFFHSNELTTYQHNKLYITLDDNYSAKRLPLSHTPKQNVISLRDIVLGEGDWFHRCSFRGKVFVLGVSKTGTTTMRHVLQTTFGYKCSQQPMDSCRYYGLEHYYKKGGLLPLLVAPDDISWLFHSKSLHKDFVETLVNSQVFMDAPWPFLYPMYDQLIPATHSKFILLVRNSSRDVVNSNMKMFVRRWKAMKQIDESFQYDFKNFSKLTEYKPKFGVHVSWEEFWMLLARQYELHNQNVIDYFTQRGRLHDLLVVNLGVESLKMAYSEQWYKITSFLGCKNMSDQPLPRKNNANGYQIDFFPKDYKIEWKRYKWSSNVENILKVVREMDGKYNETLWNVLKALYGEIIE